MVAIAAQLPLSQLGRISVSDTEEEEEEEERLIII